jgi:adenosine deaminase
MPKIDLHRHLEGSLRLSTLVELIGSHHVPLPAAGLDQLRPYVQVMNEQPSSRMFLAKFENLRRFYRSPEIITRLAFEAIADAAADNVHYLELRFSPQALAHVQGFPLDEVTDWVIEATERARQAHPIHVGLIVTLVRHETVALGRKVAEIAFDRHRRGIVGLDLAGDEVNFPSAPFREIFREARALGMGVTVHAGEWVGADSVRFALEELGACRIGHGVRSVESFDVLQRLLEQGIALEICLTSNLQTGVVRDLSHHPIVDLLDLGLLVTLNTDDPSVSNTLLTDEYRVAVEYLGLGYSELRRVILNAAHSAFLDETERRRLVAHFESYLPPPTLSGPPTPVGPS